MLKVWNIPANPVIIGTYLKIQDFIKINRILLKLLLIKNVFRSYHVPTSKSNGFHMDQKKKKLKKKILKVRHPERKTPSLTFFWTSRPDMMSSRALEHNILKHPLLCQSFVLQQIRISHILIPSSFSLLR